MIALFLACTTPSLTEADTWQVYALDYGRSSFRASQAVRDRGDERVPFAWMAWLLRGPDRIVLVDTGFSDPKLAEAWGITGFRPVSELLGGLEIRPEQVTDVLITHAHWDHMGDVSAYPNARVWMQKAELSWARGRVSAEKPEQSGVRHLDLVALEGRELSLLDGDGEVMPGLWAHRAGGHTQAVQWVEIRDGPRTIVLSTDIAYLYENLDRGVPPGGSQSPEQDLEQIRLMKGIAKPERLIVPGHDPQVFERFPTVADRIVEVR